MVYPIPAFHDVCKGMGEIWREDFQKFSKDAICGVIHDFCFRYWGLLLDFSEGLFLHFEGVDPALCFSDAMQWDGVPFFLDFAPAFEGN